MTRSVGIFFTPDYNLIQTYFFGSEILPLVSFDKFQDQIKKQRESLFFSTDNSRTIVSLQHAIGKDTKQAIVIEIIDPDGTFEKKFISFSITSQFLENIQNIKTKLKKENTNNFINYINQSLSSIGENKKTYYLTYGIGTDFSQWAGPFICNFSEAKVKYNSDGQRKITLYFAPVNAPAGITLGVEGEQIPLSLYNSNYRGEASIPIADSREGNLINIYDLKSPLEYNYSRVIYGVFKKYLNAIYANRAHPIILLPDINKIYNKSIENYINKHTQDSVKNNFELNFTQAKDIFKKSAIRAASFRQTAVALSVIKDVISDFGVGVTLEYNKTIDYRSLIGGTSEYRAEFFSKKSNKDPKDTVYAATISVDIKDPHTDFYKPIKILTDSLNTLGMEVILIEENNTRVLNIWKRYGIIPDSTKPAVLLVDKKLAAQFLYGAYIKEIPNKVELGQSAEKSKSFIENLVDAILDEEAQPDVTQAELRNFEYKKQQEIDNAAKRDGSFYLTKEDQSIVLNDSLIKELRETLKDTYKYQYGELEDTGIKEIDRRLGLVREINNKFKNNMPIFRFNVPNPNIEKLDLEHKSNYLTVLQAGVHRLINDFATRYVKTTDSIDLLDGRIANISKHIKEIRDHFFTKINSGSYEELTKIALSRIKTDTSLKMFPPEELAKIVASTIILLTITNNTEVSPIIQIDSKFGAESELVSLYRIYADLLSKTYSIKIRTLPMFKLSTYFDVGMRDVFLIAATLDTYGNFNNIINGILTNIYHMTGFTHVITPEDAYSEFMLVIDTTTGMTEKSVVETPTQSKTPPIEKSIPNPYPGITGPIFGPGWGSK